MILNENICDSATFWITVYIYIVSCTGTQKHFCSKGKGKYKKQKKKHKVTDISKYLQLQHQVSTPHTTEQNYMQQRNILPTSLSIQSLSGGKNNSSTIMSCSKNNSVGSVATVSSQRIAHHQSPYNNTNSYGANSSATSAAKVSNSISVQVLPTSPSTGHGNSNGSSSHRNDVRSSVGVSTASALLTTSPSSVAAHQSQQQQRLQQQQQTPPSQQYSNKVRQKSPAQLVSPVQQHTASNLAAALTPENVTQMLATMQPQTPSSSQVGQYFKQTSPTCQQPKPTQSSPIQQSPPPLYGSLKNSSTSIPTSVARSMQQPPSQINMTANNQQFMVGQQQSQQQQPQQPSPQNLSKPGGNLASASNYFPVSEIRLPTVPIPTTSMFSSITPVISQAAAAPSNYLFTNLPQHSAQPNFDVSMLQSKTIGAGNRTPVSNSNDLFSNLLNMPKWSSVGRIQRAMLNEYSKWYVYYVLVQEQCNTDTVPPTEFVMNTFISILFLTIQLLRASKFESEWGHHNE